MLPKKKQILIQLTAAPYGGVETHVYHLAMLLAVHGAELTLISLRRFDLNEQWTTDLVGAGVRIVRPPKIPSWIPSRVRLLISAVCTGRKLLRHKFDVAIGQSHGSSFIWLKYFLRASGRCVWHEHWYGVPTRGDNYTADSVSPAPRRFSIGMRAMLSRMDEIITGCERSRHNLRKIQKFHKPIIVLPPLDRIEDAPIADDRTYDADSTLHIGMIGRLGFGKGVATLIDIWKDLQIGDAHLHLHGTDPGGIFASMVSDRGLSDRIHLHGTFPRSQLCQILSRLDLGLMLSFEEGYGLVICEYMACGLPFLTTDVGAAAEFTADNLDGMRVGANKAAVKCGLELMASRVRANQTSRSRLQAHYLRSFNYDALAAEYVNVLLR